MARDIVLFLTLATDMAVDKFELVALMYVTILPTVVDSERFVAIALT